MNPNATTGQIAKIHVLAGRAGFEGDSYRDFLFQQTGKRSSKDLTRDEAGAVIERLADLSGGLTGLAAGAVAGLDSGIGRKLRALWIAGHNLGLVRDRTDRAMLSFLERQTGVSHVRFLREPGDGAKAVEGLKSWLARAGGVHWPLQKDDADAILSRRAVLEAQWVRLADAVGDVALPAPSLLDYAFKVVGKRRWDDFGTSDYAAVQSLLGRRLFASTRRGTAS